MYMRATPNSAPRRDASVPERLYLQLKKVGVEEKN